MQDFISADHPYRTPPTPRTLDHDDTRVPYAGQTRMRLTIASGLAHARVVVDPAARDLLAIECGDRPPPRIRVAAGDLSVSWPRSFGDWLRDVVSPGLDDVLIVLHPTVAWTIAIRGGLSWVELDLAAGAIARLDIAGGCSDVMLDLPAPSAVVPVHIHGGASRLDVLRPAATGVALDVRGGISRLQLDDQSFDAIGGGVRLRTDGVARYELAIAGGASELSIAHAV